MALLLLAVAGPASSQAADKFTVDDSGDFSDAVPGDGDCDSAAGGCTLRAAIEEGNAQATVDPHLIDFADGNLLIQPATALPAIAQPTQIDATDDTDCNSEVSDSVVDLDGQTNAFDGLEIAATADGSSICGLTIQRFVFGVYVKADDALVRANRIGIDVTGMLDRGNNVGVRLQNSSGSMIGGTTAAARNVISGNTSGVQLQLNVTGSEVKGNYIGTTADGLGSLGSVNGIELELDAQGATIGGTVAPAQQATDACDGACNLISGNGSLGVVVYDGSDNKIAGNHIGPDVTGGAPLLLGGAGTDPVQDTGIELTSDDSSEDNVIGGADPGDRNVISGHRFDGITVADGGTLRTAIEGNYIGLRADGTDALSNGRNGVFAGGTDTLVGGATAGAGNVISGNAQNGVALGDAGADVQGNLIGITPDGDTALGNGFGISLTSTVGATIGGSAAGEGNVISANDEEGVYARGVTDLTLEGNLIGTDADGEADLGNGANGVLLDGGSGGTVGGTGAGSGNVISGNDQNGVRVSADGAVVEGNVIGLGADIDTPLGNGLAGVSTENGEDNTIGGTAAGAGNTIAANGTDGVSIQGAPAPNNRVLGNSIYGNGDGAEDLGIDLRSADGVNANDDDDGDSAGGNRIQNFPVLATVQTNASDTDVTGALNSEPSHDYRIEFFVNDSCDDSGHGEGEALFGATVITTDVGGDADIDVTIPATAPDKFLTATATDLDLADPDGTSEFSACLAIPEPQDPDPEPSPDDDDNDGRAGDDSGGSGSTPSNQFAPRAKVKLLAGGTKGVLTVVVPGPGTLGARSRAKGVARRTPPSRRARGGTAQAESSARRKRGGKRCKRVRGRKVCAKKPRRRPLLRPAVVEAQRAGPIRIIVNLTGTGKSILAKRGVLKVPVILTFTPTGGSPASRRRVVTFRKPRAKAKRCGRLKGKAKRKCQRAKRRQGKTR